jgi:hypothetical protein
MGPGERERRVRLGREAADWAGTGFFGLGFQGMLGWVWVEFGLGFLGFFSILFPLSFLFLNQTKFEFKYRFEFKPHSNN